MTGDAVIVEEWRSLLARYSVIAHELDRELQAGHELAMSDFEALDRIMGIGCGEKLRVQEVAADMYLSQSALSRTIARLEKRGLVTRNMCDTDRRGVFVCPTPAGRDLHTTARETYLAVLSRHASAVPAEG